jgi:coniferyl-aldehyde dehydrogenase
MTADIAYLQTLQQPLEALDRLFAAQRAAYAANPMPPAAQRQQWLKSLRDLLSSERQALIEAISADFSHRSADETLLAELMPSLHGIHYASRHLKRWMKASRRKVGVAFQPASAKVIYQPLGVVGVIVPWNYPLYLAIGPLVGALAAGNRVMLKLSESTPATGLLLKQLLARVFPEDLAPALRSSAVHRLDQRRQARDARRS